RAGVDGADDPARPRPRRGGAGGADHARDGGGGDAPRARAHRPARDGARAAAHDPHRELVRTGAVMPDNQAMDRNLALEAVRVTEAAALSASRLMGRGDEKAADQAAVDAMREALNSLAIAGTVVIGEGERDEAPMLYIGEKVGSGNGPPIDIALDPLEGTTITAKGGGNALAGSAMADAGGFLNAPDVYMEKIAVGGGLPEDIVDLDETPASNLKNLAQAKKAEIADLVVCILDRPRHAELIAKVREAGARITLISDGDVSGVIATDGHHSFELHGAQQRQARR